MGRNLARWNFGENGRQGHTWNLRSGRLVEEGGVTCEEGCHCHHCYRCSVDGYDLLTFKVLTRSYLWKYVLRYNHCPISEQLLEIYGGENIEGDYFFCLTSNIVGLVPSRLLEKVKDLDNETPFMVISNHDKVAFLFEIDWREGVLLFLLMFFGKRSRV